VKVFITGASSGLGAALARRYSTRGDAVALVARRRETLDALALEFGATTTTHAVDVTDHAAVARAAADHLAALGCPDVVIANAGISAGTLTGELDDLAVFERIVAVNLNSIVATFQPFIEPMTRRGSGRLVVIASVAGFRGLPGSSAYSASKAAAISYAESLRVELAGSGVRVVTIAPGFIDTPMTEHNPYPMPFMISAEAFAASAVRAIDRGVRFRVIPWPMAIVGWLLRRLPRPIFDRAFRNAGRKPRLGS
jgi:short-subunit dehydrogenase